MQAVEPSRRGNSSSVRKGTGVSASATDAAGESAGEFTALLFPQKLAPYTSGDGWLRIREFLPDGRTIKVRTYSPLFGISSLTKHLAHRTGACDRFDMVIE